MEISRCRFVIILAIWAGITLAVGLMAGLINTGCDESDDTSTTTSPSPEETTTTDVPLPDGPWGDPFLPTGLVPEHYDIWLYPDFYYDAGTFTGREDVTVRVLEGSEPSEYVILHIKAMNVTETKLYNENGEELKVLRAFEYAPFEYWVVECESKLNPGTYRLHLKFNGSLLNGIVGYYKSTYVNALTGETRWLATSKFQPTDARKAFPNWDEPRYKATFNITLKHWQNFTAISNMPEYKYEDYDYWRETSFEKSVVMSSYLVCFIVFDFVQMNNTLANGKLNRIWAPEDRIASAEFALNYTKQAQDYLEEELDMEFQLPKLDSVAVPDYPSGATEHWGIVTYRESRLLYDPESAGANDEQNTAAIVAHEVSHHFFGNAITCAWWDDIWLNEGFANFYEQKALELIPKYQARDHFLVTTLQPVLSDDALSESRPLVKEVTHPDEVNAAFSGLVYDKGASLLRMMENFVGSEDFRDAIRVYLKKYEFDVVTTPDLYNTLQEETDIDFPSLMGPWSYQMGLPVVTISEEADSKLKLSQSRFLSDPEADPDQPESEYQYKWDIPIDYVTQTDDTGRMTITFDESEVTVDDPRSDPNNDWLILNNLQIGYTRINYNSDMWGKLATQLKLDHQEIYVADRSMLLDDAFNLARATLLDYPAALELTQYMEDEQEYFPWRSAYRGLEYISTMMYSNGAYTMWRSFILNITGPIMDDLQVEGTGTHLEILNRRNNIIPLACGHGSLSCLENVTKLFQEWLDDPSVSIDPNTRSVVYQYGMLQLSGKEGVWDEVLRRYEEEASVSEKSNLMFTLAQTDRQWLIYKYLDYATTPGKIKEQDFFTLINYIAYNPDANRYLWDWTREHYEELVEQFGTSNRYFGRMVPNIVQDYNSEFLLEEVESFFERYPDAGAGASARAEALASIRSNIAWMDRNLEPIVAWLEDFLGVEA